MTLLLVQLGVLALTAVLWWRARLDLTARAAGLPPASEWERLRQTVEQLTADLERRAVVAEQRVSAAEERLRAVGNGPHPPSPSPVGTGEGEQKDITYSPSARLRERGLGGEGLADVDGLSEPEPDRYADAELLIAQGADDPHDVARRTGITRGEAELLLSLRARCTF